ncbi:MAG: GIY-YIG nuclease family protein [Clostridium sp.]|nr:GIY-YIG nuclease family protein [Clostridium sp.]
MKIYGIIYKVENLIDGKIYIGLTTSKYGFKGRYHGEGIQGMYKYYKSRKDRGFNYNRHLYYAIEKYGFDNFKITERFDIAFSKEELDIKEKTYIALYKSAQEEYGYNLDLGGSCGKHSETTKNKMSKIMKEKYKNGTYTNHQKGKPLDEAHKQALIESNYVKIICLNNNKIFESLIIASKEYGILTSAICQACKGKHKSCNGLAFRYYDDYLNMSEKEIEEAIEESKRNQWDNATEAKYKKIVCLDERKVFNSIKEAGEYYNIKCRSGISQCLVGKSKICEGHTWVYYDEYINMTNEEIENFIKEKQIRKTNAVKIRCITTGEVFNSMTEASKKYNTGRHISSCCTGKRKYAGKLEDGTKLQWEYYKECE